MSYTLFWEGRGPGDAAARVQGIYTTAQAANDDALADSGMGDALADAGMGLEDLLSDDCTVDMHGCFTPNLYFDNPPQEDTYLVRRLRLCGSIPSSAPLNLATARALHIVAGAQRDAAAALFANTNLRSSRVDSMLFAAVWHGIIHYGRHDAQLMSVWRSRAEAKQEARRLIGEDEWQRMRQAALRGCYLPGIGNVSASDLSDDSGASDGEDSNTAGNASDGEADGYDDDDNYSFSYFCGVEAVKLTS